MAEVELAGTRDAVALSQRWVEAPPPHGVEELKDEVTAFRDPFVTLIRRELGVDD